MGGSSRSLQVVLPVTTSCGSAMSTSVIPIAIDFNKVSAALGSGDRALLEQLMVKYRDELAEIDELAEELDEDDSDEEDEDSGSTDLRALSQALEEAKQNLKGGQSVNEMLKGLGQMNGVSANNKKALEDFFDESGDDCEVDDDEEFASATDVLRHIIIGEKPARRVAHEFKYGFALLYVCQHLGEELPRGDVWLELRGSTWRRTLDKALKDARVPAKTLSISKHLANRGSPYAAIPKYSGTPEIGYLKIGEIESAQVALRSATLKSVGTEEQECLADVHCWLQTCADSKRDLICFAR